MHFLQRLLHSDAQISEELARDEAAVQQELRGFLQSYAAKQRVLEALLRGEPIYMHLATLQQALQGELRLIEDSEEKEAEVIADLKYLSHEHYIKQLEELRVELDQARLHDTYTHKILEELRDTLLSQARKVKRLLGGEHSVDVRDALISLLTIEQHLVEQLSENNEFTTLFRNLFVGTRRRDLLHTLHERLHDKLASVMQNVEVGVDGRVRSLDGHYLSELTARIFNRLEYAVMEAVRNGQIDSHPAVDAEFVNGPLFVKFVDDEIALDRSLGKFTPSPRTLEAFITVFRSIYASATGVAR